MTRSLTIDYNHDTIIRAARILKDRHIRAEIMIIGDGPLMDSLKMLSKNLDVDDIITFMGRIPNEELPQYISNSNMYISVPVTEGVSASLFEAMGGGAFPVVTDLPGLRPWITHGQNGFLVPVRNAEALAESIILAWHNTDLMKNAIISNRILVEAKADFKKNMLMFVKWYKELIQNK